MPTTWNLEHDGITKPLAQWGAAGLTGLTRRRVNQGVDVLTFQHDGAAFDAEPLFAVGDTIKIHRDEDGVSVQWFEGRVHRVPRFGSPTAESQSYQITGPWWYLERLVYQQGWNVEGGAGISVLNKSRVLLFHSLTGTKLTLAEQLEDVLQYAKTTAGLPLDYSTDDFPTVNPPIDEGQDLTCAEVLKRCLRWAPDAVVWWDYTTSPPTLSIKPRASLAVGALDLAATDYQVSVADIGSREDLQLPAVLLKFEQTNTVNGQQYLQVTEQRAPNESVTGLETSALVATIQLSGYAISEVSSTIECAAVAEGSTAWWQTQVPWLAKATVEVAAVTETSRLSSLPRYLVRGQLAPWMDVAKADDTVAAKIRYRVYSSATVHDETTLLGEYEELFTTRLVATDAASGTYRSTESIDYGEEVPVGLAQALYDANATLQWEGGLEVVEEEITGTADLLGSTLNLTNGHASWTTMAATVQEVEENVDNGTTRLRFGPAQHLGPADLIELLRANRHRRVYVNPATRVDGVNHATSVALGNQTPLESATAGNAQPRRVRVGNKGDTTKGEIDLDPSRADVAGGTGYSLKPRWTKVCDNGTERWCLVIRSAAIDALPSGAVED